MLAQTVREQSAELLNKYLAAAIDLQGQVKQARWNAKGPDSNSIRILLEKVSDEVQSCSELIAERTRGLGALAQGTVQFAAKRFQSRDNESPV